MFIPCENEKDEASLKAAGRGSRHGVPRQVVDHGEEEDAAADVGKVWVELVRVRHTGRRRGVGHDRRRRALHCE